MRNIATAVRRLNDIKRQAADEVDRITRWVELTSKSPQNTVEYFEKALKEFMVRLREETGRKSLELPDGTVKSRQSSASVEILDIETFIKWAENNGHAGWVRVKKEIDKAAVRDGVEFIGDAVLDNLTGEVVDGVTVSPESVSVSITVSE
jgi:phage host-nuclease inhibitor protein Gam